jgi:hypothetical protein
MRKQPKQIDDDGVDCLDIPMMCLECDTSYRTPTKSNKWTQVPEPSPVRKSRKSIIAQNAHTPCPKPKVRLNLFG